MRDTHSVSGTLPSDGLPPDRTSRLPAHPKFRLGTGQSPSIQTCPSCLTAVEPATTHKNNYCVAHLLIWHQAGGATAGVKCCNQQGSPGQCAKGTHPPAAGSPAAVVGWLVGWLADWLVVSLVGWWLVLLAGLNVQLHSKNQMQVQACDVLMQWCLAGCLVACNNLPMYCTQQNALDAGWYSGCCFVFAPPKC